MAHELNCTCARCEGLRRYPQPSKCDWCHQVHAGDSNNCDPETERFEDLDTNNPIADALADLVHRRIKAITIEVEQRSVTMLPTNGGSAPRTKRAGALPYIKNEQLSTTPKTAKILAVKVVDGRFGQQVLLKLAFEGGTWFLGLNTKVNDNGQYRNPNYKLLIDKFGPDENNWVDQSILLFLEQDDFSGQYFMRADFPTTTAAKR